MHHVTKLEKIGRLRSLPRGRVPDVFDKKLTRLLIKKVVDNLVYPYEIKKGRVIVSYWGDLDIYVTSDSIVVAIYADTGISNTFRWDFDGDLTDSDISEISREVNNFLSQMDPGSQSAKDAERVSKISNNRKIAEIKSSNLVQSMSSIIGDDANIEVFLTKASLRIVVGKRGCDLDLCKLSRDELLKLSTFRFTMEFDITDYQFTDILGILSLDIDDFTLDRTKSMCLISPEGEIGGIDIVQF